MEDPRPPAQEPQITFGAWTPVFPPPPPTELPSDISVEEMKRIYGLLDRFRGHSDVRSIAEQMLTSESPRLASLQPIIKPLIRPARHQWRERQVAAWILGRARMDPTQRDFAINALIEVVEGKLDPEPQDRIKISLLRAVLPTLLTIPLILADGPGEVANEFPGLPIALYLFFCFPLAMLYTLIEDRRASARICAEAMLSLGRIRATQALPHVAEAAAMGYRTRRRGKGRRLIQSAARMALPRILETLTVDYYGQVPSDTMVYLSRMLRDGDETLVVSILNAFANVGNNLVLSEVEKLAGGQGRAAREPRVQEAAQYALPQIQARIARQNEPRTLLRASVQPQPPQEQLLRPILEPEPIDPMEMLRASSNPDWQGTEEEIALVLQILQHLNEQGDMRALPFVEQIAQSPTSDPRVRSAAQECLPVLKAHQELERYSPSQPPVLDLQRNL